MIGSAKVDIQHQPALARETDNEYAIYLNDSTLSSRLPVFIMENVTTNEMHGC